MKKILAVLSVALALSVFGGCSSDDDTPQQTSDDPQVQTVADGSTEAAESWKIELRAAPGDVTKTYITSGGIHYDDGVKEWHFTNALTSKEVYVNNTWYMTMEQQ